MKNFCRTVIHLTGFLLFVLMFTNCASMMGPSSSYLVSLSEVEAPKVIKEKFGETKVARLEEEGITKYNYEDSLINISWLPTSESFAFTMKNKTNNAIKIIWDEAVYVDETGVSRKIMHSGVKYIDKNNSQPPTVIVKNASVDDIVLPSDNVHYVSGQYGGWSTKPLFPRPYNTTLAQQYRDMYVGKTVRIYLPIEIEGVTNEYLFTFKVDDLKFSDSQKVNADATDGMY